MFAACIILIMISIWFLNFNLIEISRMSYYEEYYKWGQTPNGDFNQQEYNLALAIFILSPITLPLMALIVMLQYFNYIPPEYR